MRVPSEPKRHDISPRVQPAVRNSASDSQRLRLSHRRPAEFWWRRNMKNRDARESTDQDDPKVLRVVRPPLKPNSMKRSCREETGCMAAKNHLTRGLTRTEAPPSPLAFRCLVRGQLDWNGLWPTRGIVNRLVDWAVVGEPPRLSAPPLRTATQSTPCYG